MTHRIVPTMEPISRREFQKRALAASLAAAFDGHGGLAQRSALDPADACRSRLADTRTVCRDLKR